MIIFSQGPTKHSRIGNSLVWMKQAHFYLQRLGLEAIFPWAIENFRSYLNEKSFWLGRLDAADALFETRFGVELTAANLSHVSRQLEHKYEKAHGLEPFAWQQIVVSDKEFNCIYLTGKIDLSSDEIVGLILKEELVICHEPFDFVYIANENLRGEIYTDVCPRQDLYDEQLLYIESHSGSCRPKIGLHIRRGDYETWREGVYCYDDEFWIAMVMSMVAKGNVIWVFSNELTESFHSRLVAAGANISNETFEIDFVRLMCMDQVYGPPSTFSVMAVNISKVIYGRSSSFTYLPSKSEL